LAGIMVEFGLNLIAGTMSGSVEVRPQHKNVGWTFLSDKPATDKNAQANS